MEETSTVPRETAKTYISSSRSSMSFVPSVAPACQSCNARKLLFEREWGSFFQNPVLFSESSWPGGTGFLCVCYHPKLNGNRHQLLSLTNDNSLLDVPKNMTAVSNLHLKYLPSVFESLSPGCTSYQQPGFRRMCCISSPSF